MTRRVVTGKDASGKAVFVGDGEPDRDRGREVIWTWDATPEVPTDGRLPEHVGYFPPPDGLRAIVVAIPPHTPREEQARTEFPDSVDVDRATPGRHRTNTIDVGLVLAGNVFLELDDGAETELHAGDWFIQNGTWHRWRNPYDEPCRLAVIVCGAEGA
jgi:hypothetical protein